MKPLIKEVQEDWSWRSFDWVKFQRQAEDLEWDVDTKARQIRSNWRCWITFWFGKDWLFHLWMIFGKVNEDMMKCLNDICRKRGALSLHDNDPASSRGDVSNLSDRNRAIELGLIPIPEVKGIQHSTSDPQLARIAARKREKE